MWNKLLAQASQHPIMIRDVYKIILSKDDSYYIREWMNYAGSKNLNIQMPEILKNDSIKVDIKNDILSHWKKISPKDYDKYLEGGL